MSAFQGLLFEPVELQVGLGDVFRTITPSFLRKEEEEDDFFAACCPRLSLRQRLLGWLCCFGLGTLLQALSFGAVTRALLGHPARFAIMYTLGNIVSLTGTMFLAGPAKQLRNMTRHNRIATTAVFLLAMVLTLLAVEADSFPGRALLILLLVAIQWMALVWYTLSYIPYGRKMARKLLGKLCSWCCQL